MIIRPEQIIIRPDSHKCQIASELLTLAREQTGTLKTMTLQRARNALISCDADKKDSLRLAKQDWRGFPQKSCEPLLLDDIFRFSHPDRCIVVHFGGWRKTGPSQWSTQFVKDASRDMLMMMADNPQTFTKLRYRVKVDCKSALFATDDATGFYGEYVLKSMSASKRRDLRTRLFHFLKVPDEGSLWEEVVIALCDQRQQTAK
jgi:hypothetical protein